MKLKIFWIITILSGNFKIISIHNFPKNNLKVNLKVNLKIGIKSHLLIPPGNLSYNELSITNHIQVSQKKCD